MKRWQDVDSIYQIYPLSFKDTDADGTGDLEGIIKKINYLKGDPESLGVDAIWICPFYDSPMADFGYDVSDYYTVDGRFGDLGDFRKLLSLAHERGIRVMIDFVPNHTSDKHGWFKRSRMSRKDDKRDWYVWHDPKPDGSPPNNWISHFGGSAWEFDNKTGQYYLHSYLKEQPDLNWDNPEVRSAMLDVLRFWLDLGVDGIRADAVRGLSKDPELRDNLPDPSYREGEMDPFRSQLHKYDQYGPNLFDYLGEITEVIQSYEDRIVLFEDYPADSVIDMDERYSRYFSINPEVSAPFNFEGVTAPYNANHFRKFISKFQANLKGESRPFYSFGNHDNSRLASRYGRPQAKLIGLMQLTLPGTPVMYYGDELGMEDADIPKTGVLDAVEKNVPGFKLGRDPVRSPMKWSEDELNAGFTKGDPWLPVSESDMPTDVDSEEHNPNSFLSMYQKLLRLRHSMPVFRCGAYEEWSGCNDNLYGYFLKNEENKIFVILNMSDKDITYKDNISGKILCSTHPVENDRFDDGSILKPHQGLVLDTKLEQSK